MFDLKNVLKKHKDWLLGNPNGVRANLRGADLSYANLSGADLSYADLRVADLSYANLRDADLCDADLSYANLRNANLRGADLRNAKLYNSKNIESINWYLNTSFYPLQCPESGSYIGYKKAHKMIIKLEILNDSLRSSATSRKCRASKAKVLSITSFDEKQNVQSISSDYDENFIYEVGKIVEVTNFDTNRWNECSTGIHHFITREEAVKY